MMKTATKTSVSVTPHSNTIYPVPSSESIPSCFGLLYQNDLLIALHCLALPVEGLTVYHILLEPPLEQGRHGLRRRRKEWWERQVGAAAVFVCVGSVNAVFVTRGSL